MFKRRGNLKGTWPQALASLVGAILMILTIRWAFFEPYVIPSGSMIPTLLINDHILVNKLSYGIRVPFSTKWLVNFGAPERGDVVVFRSVDDEGVFVVKRVVGLPGDEVRILESGELVINGKKVEREPMKRADTLTHFRHWRPDDLEDLLETNEVYAETLGKNRFLSLWSSERTHAEQGPFVVPKDSVFMMGDNRDNSSDSRVWGSLPLNRILGRASYIWLSCEETLPDSGQLCDPKTIRFDRMFRGVW